MQFEKPKVTIDLEEYQYLNEQKSKLDDVDWYTAARMILFAFSNHQIGAGGVSRYLSSVGISFIMTPSGTKVPSYEDISIAFHPKKRNNEG